MSLGPGMVLATGRTLRESSGRRSAARPQPPGLGRGLRQRRARPQASSLTLVSARHNDPPMSATSEKSDVEGSAVYPTGSRVNARGHLEVGGCDVVEVVAEFGTPVYIYAEDDIRARARAYLDAFRSRTEDCEVLYASKAAPLTAIYRLCAELALSVDVASGGELHMALRAGFDSARVYLHGNNKTEAELRYAAEAGAGHVIVDSFSEIARR